MQIFLGFVFGVTLSWSALASANTLSFVTEEFFPFSYSTLDPATGKSHAGGPMVEVVQLVCQRIDHRCTFEIYPWRRALTLAEQGDADGIFTVVRSPQRLSTFRLTQMLVRSHYALLALRGSDFHYRGPQDLAGKTIGVYGPSGTSHALSQNLKAVPSARMHVATDNLLLLRMLASGRFGKNGLVTMNQHVARNLLDAEKIDNVRMAGQLEPVEYGIGFSRKSVDRAQFRRFRNALDAAIKDGSIDEILDRYGLDPAYRAR